MSLYVTERFYLYKNKSGKVIKGVFTRLDVPIDKLKFVRGTSFQLDNDYTLDVYKLMTKMTLRDAQKAGTEVVKQSKNPMSLR